MVAASWSLAAFPSLRQPTGLPNVRGYQTRQGRVGVFSCHSGVPREKKTVASPTAVRRDGSWNEAEREWEEEQLSSQRMVAPRRAGVRARDSDSGAGIGWRPLRARDGRRRPGAAGGEEHGRRGSRCGFSYSGESLYSGYLSICLWIHGDRSRIYTRHPNAVHHPELNDQPTRRKQDDKRNRYGQEGRDG
ncbi:hypothetical protein VTN02DRAFT_4059 [Thermoascus thermophilus]